MCSIRFVLDGVLKGDNEVFIWVGDDCGVACVIQQTALSAKHFCAIAVELSLPAECLGARLHDLLTARKCGSGDHGVDVGQVRNYGENLEIWL